MSLTVDGKGLCGFLITGDGSQIDLIDSNGNIPSSGLNYSPISCYWRTWPSPNLTDLQKEHMCLWGYDGTGALTNLNEFTFPEADDPTYDYGSGTPGAGWGTISQIKVTNASGQVWYADLTNASGTATPVSVPQDYQLRFKAGTIKISWNVTEVSS